MTICTKNIKLYYIKLDVEVYPMKLLYITLLIGIYSGFQANGSFFSSQSNYFDYSQPLPAHLKQILDQNYQQIKEHAKPLTGAVTFKFLPNWYVKNSAEARLNGAKKLAAAIQTTNKSDLFILPRKYLYEGINNRTYAIAEHIEKKDDIFSQDEIKEIIRVAKNSKWYDCHSGNFFRTSSGKIAIIDTESNADNVTNEYELKFMIVHKLLTKSNPKIFTSEAKNYLEKKYQDYIDWPKQEHIDYLKNRKDIKNRYKRTSNQLYELMGF